MNFHKSQLESLVSFFNQGAALPREFLLGLEIEHILVDKQTREAIPYYGDRGVEVILQRLRPLYDEEIHGDPGRLLGLTRPLLALTLEPGAQFETSMGPLATVEEFRAVYERFLVEIIPVLDELGIEMLNIGYQPVSKQQDVQIIPKSRYRVMNEYLATTGKYGHHMMRCSASTQVSIDYQDEADAVRKMRVATALLPIFAYHFSNTPYFEGQVNGNRMIRVQMWDDLDPLRCSTIPGLFDEGFGFESYAKMALSTPLMVIDLTESEDAPASTLPLVRIGRTESATTTYPDRELNSFEIAHILSTFFFDVRLKNYIELRSVDCLPIDRALEYTQLIKDVFYNEANLQEIAGLLEGITSEDVADAKYQLQAFGESAQVYGRDLQWWWRRVLKERR
jgi:glutamate--cysteine ligase